MSKKTKETDISKDTPIEKKPKAEVVEEAKAAQEELERIARVKKEVSKLQNLRRHIDKVQDAVLLLAQRLIERGEVDFAKVIVANSMTHDVSKFSGIEWEYLVKDDPHAEMDGDKLQMAIYQHVTSNDHHPERWGGVANMPREALAEMVCDWYARASESAKDLRDWVKNEALKKYSISPQGKVYKSIKYFIDILLDAPLKTIKPKV